MTADLWPCCAREDDHEPGPSCEWGPSPDAYIERCLTAREPRGDLRLVPCMDCWTAREDARKVGALGWGVATCDAHGLAAAGGTQNG